MTGLLPATVGVPQLGTGRCIILTSCSASAAGEAGCEKMLRTAVQRLTREQLGDAVAAMCTALQEQACVSASAAHHLLVRAGQRCKLA